MRNMMKLALAATVASLALPLQAGEVTGNGKSIDINARSECAYSGLNDHFPDPRDPGAHTQNYGTLVSLGIINPQNLDPNADVPFVPIPGFACNPNRGRDLHGD